MPTLVEVRGHYEATDGTPAAGRVTFGPRVDAVTDAVADIIARDAAVNVTLDASGEFAVDLWATDDPGVSPTGWTYEVAEYIAGAPNPRTYDIDVPAAAAGTGVDLSDVAPVTATSGDPSALVTLSAFSAHVADTTGVHGIANTAALGLHGEALPRRSFVALGDSIVMGGGSYNPAVGGIWDPGALSWVTWAAALSKQNLALVSNAGVGGDNTTQMLARIVADVIVKTPQVCIIGGATNDVTQGVDPAATLANYGAMVTLLRAASIEPVLLSLTPHSANGLTRRRLSVRLREFADKNGIRFVDVYTPVADIVTGAYTSAMTYDGVHPTQAGALAIATQIVTAIFEGIPPLPGIWRPGSNADPLNLWINGLAQNDINSDNIPDNWTAGGTATSGSRAIAADPDVVGGKIARMVVVSGASSFLMGSSISTGLTVGHRYAVSGRVKTSGIVAGSGNWFVQSNWQDAGSVGKSPYYRPLGSGQIIDLADGYFYFETTMPAGATKLDVRVVLLSGAGTVGLTEAGVVDLTAAGVTGYQAQA